MSTVRHHYSQGRKRSFGPLLNFILAIVILGAAIAAVIYFK
jgi:hypothetical protein